MSKRLSPLSVTLRTDNTKAILLIKAIFDENLESISQIINSTTAVEKLRIVESIKIQVFENCAAYSDNKALVKLADECKGKDSYQIKSIISIFVNGAECQKVFELDQAREQEKIETINNLYDLHDQQAIAIMGQALIDLANLEKVESNGP